MAVTQEIEIALGRPQPPRHGARLIDIDILLFGDERIDTPELQIPHPRMLHRAFVLRPLSDVLEGGWVRQAPDNWEQG
jgi:2-amino-4-hydroxy-6-hydroxymethyldihydropteridine diphosphokinase